jgi:molybdopterin-containing oxidoreductase family iron-sulfur binding subunit
MKKYWRSLEEVVSGPVNQQEEYIESADKENILSMLDGIPFKQNASRRDFLKLMSYSVTSAALLAACQKPVQHAIPFLIQPNDITPGIASHFASTFYDGSEFCPVVVKVRDGRPIKLEGNKLYSWASGGTSPRVQASVLSLYDNARIKGPSYKGKPINWNKLDNEIIASLTKINSEGKEIVILASSIYSPSTRNVIENFSKVFPQTRVVYYDGISYSGILEAYREVTGIEGIPYPRFENADVIVNFGADFLGTWLMPTEFALSYVKRRKVEKEKTNMSRHIQLEPNMSLTGSNADERIQIKLSDEPAIMARLYNLVASKTGGEPIPVQTGNSDLPLERIAAELLAAKGKSIVLSGSNDISVQKIVIAINRLLGSFGNTIATDRPILIRKGSDKQLFDLVSRMQEGRVGAVLFYNTNPVYDYYDQASFLKAIEKTELKISFASFPDETIPHCDYVCPDFHFLESWNDFEPRKGIYSVSQPTIHHIFDTRQVQDSLLTWMKAPDSYADFLRNNWKNSLYPQIRTESDFETFWIKLLQNGCLETNTGLESVAVPFNADMRNVTIPESGTKFELQLVVPVPVSSPYHSNNPWLQELPDPVSRVTWDNYASVSPKLADEKGIETGDILKIGELEIPALVQPGQRYEVISIGLNYGRKGAGKVAENVGINVYPYLTRSNEAIQYFREISEPQKTGKKEVLAQSQTHHTLEGRNIVRETTLSEYKNKPNAGNEMHEEFEKMHHTLYPDREYTSFHWGMGVDLNSCIGCGACTIACQAENNVAVVGKEQVIKRRIMHWIRIDRYYLGAPEAPSVVYQPMTCQHCDNAPCENVCPVAATTHSNEGLNQMAYSRCVGTRYCINNCPYKVRRFNWFRFTDNPKFDYNQTSELGKLVLNPDVVVRERGVVEKCTFCVQRIQEKKLAAKLENRTLQDGEVIPACVQACPADALSFGDLNDKHSNIFKLYSNERNYHVLEELHTLPKIGYLTKVRNTEA